MWRAQSYIYAYFYDSGCCLNNELIWGKREQENFGGYHHLKARDCIGLQYNCCSGCGKTVLDLEHPHGELGGLVNEIAVCAWVGKGDVEKERGESRTAPSFWVSASVLFSLCFC